MTANEPYVLFHNRVYGCSGVKPEKYPCNGPKFTYVKCCKILIHLPLSNLSLTPSAAIQSLLLSLRRSFLILMHGPPCSSRLEQSVSIVNALVYVCCMQIISV